MFNIIITIEIKSKFLMILFTIGFIIFLHLTKKLLLIDFKGYKVVGI